jgi:hypothetical protein
VSANPPSPGGGSSDLIHPSQPPKDPILICVLNLLVVGGVGYIVMGQKIKGIIAIVAWLAIAIPTCGTGSMLLAVVTAVDGYLQAEKLKQGKTLGPWTFFQQHM